MKDIRQKIMEQANAPVADAVLLDASAAPQIREIGVFNGRGLWTLTAKEIRRFLKIWIQTILSPLIMTVLFYAVFAVAPHGARTISGMPFLTFLIPGLVMMSMAQAAFINGSASLILSKLQGNIVDLLMAPLSPMELTIGYAVAGVARGLIVGGVSLATMAFLSPLHVPEPGAVLYFAFMGTLMLSLIGLITGIWGQDFDHMGAVLNFIVMPATFLSGTFFSISNLPPEWSWACTFNPFFYMIDGFRYGFTGRSESGILGGMAILLFMNMALFNAAYWMFARSARLRT